jgi:hypothetical protein
MMGGSLRGLCKQTGDMAAFMGVIEHHAERCEAAQHIDERTISTPPRNERRTGENARQCSHA